MFIFTWQFLTSVVLVAALLIVVARRIDTNVDKKLFYGALGPVTVSVALFALVFAGSVSYAAVVRSLVPAEQLEQRKVQTHHHHF